MVYYQFDDEVATESAPEAPAVSTLALVVTASTPACVATATSAKDAPIKSLEILDLNTQELKEHLMMSPSQNPSKILLVVNILYRMKS